MPYRNCRSWEDSTTFVKKKILAGMKKSGFYMNIPGTFKSITLTFFLQYKFYIDSIYSNFWKSCYSEMLRMQVNRIMSFKSFKTVLPAKNISLQYRNDHYLSFQCYFPGFSWPLSVLDLLVRHFCQFLVWFPSLYFCGRNWKFKLVSCYHKV